MSPAVDVDGRRLELSNLDKVLYPAVGFTKGQVIDYYTRIAPVVLPHLHGRPLTLKRYPDGVEGKFFYEKQCPKHRPDWVQTAAISRAGGSRSSGKVVEYCLAQDLPTLVWAANLADLELHTSLARAEEIGRPTMVVFDLDPGPGTDVVDCCRIAVRLREAFEALGLEGFAKTSGSKGLQVCVPLNVDDVGYAQTSPFAQALAQLLERRHPDAVVSRQTKALRENKILIDWSQNSETKTTVCVYSLRARDRPTVSTPVTWDEVEDCLEAGDPDLLVFDSAAVLERVDEHGDLFAGVLELEQELPELGGSGGQTP